MIIQDISKQYVVCASWQKNSNVYLYSIPSPYRKNINCGNNSMVKQNDDEDNPIKTAMLMIVMRISKVCAVCVSGH